MFMNAFVTQICAIIFYFVVPVYGFSTTKTPNFNFLVLENDSLFQKYNAHDLDKVKTEILKSKKLIFIDFYADWCGPCKFMDKNVFVEKRVIDMLNTEFVSIKVNVDLPESRSICTQYRVDSYPTYIIIDSRGIVKIRLEGATPINNLLEEMDLALKR